MSAVLSLFTGSQDLPPAGSNVDQMKGHVTSSLNLLVSTVAQLEGHLWLLFPPFFPFWMHLMTPWPLFLVLSNEEISECRGSQQGTSTILLYHTSHCKGTCYILLCIYLICVAKQGRGHMRTWVSQQL